MVPWRNGGGGGGGSRGSIGKASYPHTSSSTAGFFSTRAMERIIRQSSFLNSIWFCTICIYTSVNRAMPASLSVWWLLTLRRLAETATLWSLDSGRALGRLNAISLYTWLRLAHDGGEGGGALVWVLQICSTIATNTHWSILEYIVMQTNWWEIYKLRKACWVV